MANVYLCPWATVFQYFTDTGVILSGGKVYIYLAGTSTPQVTYTDITGAVPNANPIILNSNGRLPNVSIWQPGGVAVKIIVTDSLGNQLGPTFDQLQGINDLVLVDTALADPATGFGADLVANAVRSYDIFASARAANVPVLQSGQTLIVEFEGGNTVADGLGGAFYWNALSTGTDDSLTIIAPTGVAIGRYLRITPLRPFTAVKPAQGTATSSTAVTSDSDLSIALPGVGTWLIEAWLNDALGSSAGGLQGQISYTGTFNNGKWAMNGNGGGVTTVALTAINSSAELQSAQAGTASMKFDGVVQATATGTLSVAWAQHTSNITPSVIGPGSWLRLTRLSATTGSFTPVTNIYNGGTGSETIPLGASTLTMEGIGGGGGGGQDSGTFGGGGGGGGSYFKYVINVSAASGQTINFSVGHAGARRGGNGGPTVISAGTFSFPTLTAGGGVGGGAATVGGAGSGGSGGTATGGQVNTSGNTGGAGTNLVGGTGAAALTGIYISAGSGGAGAEPGDDLPPNPGTPGSVAFHYT